MIANIVGESINSLLELETLFLQKQSEIESWLRLQPHITAPPFYSSVDLRNAGYKLAPVDTNLFPAGFNNLNKDHIPLAVQSIQDAIERICPSACNLLLIPESHTRNMLYLENLASLIELLKKAGLEVKVGGLQIDKEQNIDLPSGAQLNLHPMQVKEGHLGIGDFTPCVSLLNNDLASGVPDLLRQAEATMFIPPLELGWSSRLKSGHFAHYAQVATEFGKIVGIDPWFIDPLFKNCGDINFKTREGEECLAENADELLTGIRKKYKEYGIEHKPFVLVKADAGTYGMGIMTIYDPMDVVDLNRKQRNKMTRGKGGIENDKVILQEGVYTFETLGEDNKVCEPVVYMIDKNVVGGFYRVHTKRGIDENLNAPGMEFEPISFSKPLTTPERDGNPDDEVNRFYAYGVVARLAMLAAAREIAEVLK